MNLTNKKFGYLKVLQLDGKDKWRYNMWSCECVCGAVIRIRSSSLMNGYTLSCGCMMGFLQKNNPRNTTHGQAVIRKGTRESKAYAAYHNAHQRCTNPGHESYKWYGGRGVKFLFTSFEQFFSELGPRPKGLTLDRKNPEGNYEPGNVRWATWKQQANNKRTA